MAGKGTCRAPMISGGGADANSPGLPAIVAARRDGSQRRCDPHTTDLPAPGAAATAGTAPATREAATAAGGESARRVASRAHHESADAGAAFALEIARRLQIPRLPRQDQLGDRIGDDVGAKQPQGAARPD